MTWQLVYTKQAQKDAKKLTQSNLRDKAQALLDIIEINPFQNPPPYEDRRTLFSRGSCSNIPSQLRLHLLATA